MLIKSVGYLHIQYKYNLLKSRFFSVKHGPQETLSVTLNPHVVLFYV